MWKFLSAHPIAGFFIASTLVGGVVGIAQAIRGTPAAPAPAPTPVSTKLPATNGAY